MSDKPNAYNVWLCGKCDSETVWLDNGDHLCESCGEMYDHAGRNITGDDEDQGDLVDAASR